MIASPITSSSSQHLWHSLIITCHREMKSPLGIPSESNKQLKYISSYMLCTKSPNAVALPNPRNAFMEIAAAHLPSTNPSPSSTSLPYPFRRVKDLPNIHPITHHRPRPASRSLPLPPPILITSVSAAQRSSDRVWRDGN